MDEDITKISKLLEQFPLYSEDLGIDLATPSGRFRWFVASILFGARISEQIAANTYRCLEAAGIVGPFEGSKARRVLFADEYSLEQFLSKNE